MCRLIAGAECESGEVDLAGTGCGLATARIVCRVVEYEVNQVRRGLGANGYQRTQIHQKRALAIENQDLAVGRANGNPETKRRSLAHAAEEREVKIFPL